MLKVYLPAMGLLAAIMTCSAQPRTTVYQLSPSDLDLSPSPLDLKENFGFWNSFVISQAESPRPASLLNFELPSSNGRPATMIAGPDENLWFTQPFLNSIAKAEFPSAAPTKSITSMSPKKSRL